ncbi:heavy-metal-associated domain-containing protein [Piscinibacter koreensis]|uniref:Heavy-metal-associated domain-containing protein n=1 Tax=Piscinibacter koreensis TaxID=2742824 RepID=A0A7Y6NSA6_9BURK|nr:heavy-metal-associated domain-containing protein [Schlegelella koreensis]NUZ08427.1 heavy-metal-associated domain-containing protein [Schlegelella koreensis]
MISFQVSDMTCGHCVSTITKAIEAADKNATVNIDLASQRVAIEPTEADAQQLREAIEDAGYTPVAVPTDAVAPASKPRRGCCGG